MNFVCPIRYSLLRYSLHFRTKPCADFIGQVVGVLDGDTIEVLHNKTTQRVRLAGIDCPEKKQPFGQRAKQETSTLSFGRNVIVHRAGKDRYGRTVGTVELTNGTSLNYELVRQGVVLVVLEVCPG
jgi:micrococcal nuclease